MPARQKTTDRIPFTGTRKEVVLARSGGICMHCGKPVKIHDDFTVEHVIPLSKGGTNDLSNLVALCEKCNKDKDNDIVPFDYYLFGPKVIRDEIKQILDDYNEENDWLTSTNVFQHDRFTVPTMKIIPLKNGKTIKKEAFIEIRKMKIDEAFKYKLAYSKILNEGDGIAAMNYMEQQKKGTADSGPIYQALLNGKPFMAFDYYLGEGTVTDGPFQDAGSNVFYLTIYIKPDIKWSTSTEIIVFDTIQGIIDKLKESIEALDTKGFVICYVQCYESDKHGYKFIDGLSQIWGNSLIGTEDPISNYRAIKTVTYLDCGMSELYKEDPNGRHAISSEDFLKLDKQYRGKLKRRVKKNEKQDPLYS